MFFALHEGLECPNFCSIPLLTILWGLEGISERIPKTHVRIVYAWSAQWEAMLIERRKRIKWQSCDAIKNSRNIFTSNNSPKSNVEKLCGLVRVWKYFVNEFYFTYKKPYYAAQMINFGSLTKMQKISIKLVSFLSACIIYKRRHHKSSK